MRTILNEIETCGRILTRISNNCKSSKDREFYDYASEVFGKCVSALCYYRSTSDEYKKARKKLHNLVRVLTS